MNHDKFIILSIETSCDETSLALFENNKLKAHVITSSANQHSIYGGVVPEIANRYHESNIMNCFDELLKQTNYSLFDITHVAYTAFPGLPGSLHVGEIFAKQISSITKAKLIPINHLHAHIFSATIDQEITFPILGLVLSGGESCLYLVNDFDEIKNINQTKDDAIGECYDKVAKVLDWSYPGGPIIDRLYDESKANIEFLKPLPVENNFSFSGIKTAVVNYVHKLKQKKQPIDAIAIASSFQKFVINEVMKKVRFYLNKHQLDSIIIGGGVSANKLLRQKISELEQKSFIPQLIYTGDNAAMIGIYAYHLIKNNKQSILKK